MIETDSAGNNYIDVQNTIRVTYVRSSNRAEEANWAESDVLRVQEYKEGQKGLHLGAELPISSRNNVYEFISAICHLFDVENPD